MPFVFAATTSPLIRSQAGTHRRLLPARPAPVRRNSR
jgi:hypothetical protein